MIDAFVVDEEKFGEEGQSFVADTRAGKLQLCSRFFSVADGDGQRRRQMLAEPKM